MSVLQLFPTTVYWAPLQSKGAESLNRNLLRETLQIRADDAAGRRWSRQNYPGGYTSYGSANRLHSMSPTFDALRRRLQRHIRAFAAAVEWDLSARPLEMTDCWVNVMGRQTVHGLHLHPLSTLSGTYYVKAPRGSPGIKFEDPRLDRFMAAPPRAMDARVANKPWVTIPPRPGHVVLFESWLRHEVVAHPSAAERVSVSFNYNWF